MATLPKGALSAFLKQNPAFDFQSAQLLDPAYVKKLDFGKLDPAQMLAHLKSRQRLLALGTDAPGADQLQAAGLNSAQQVAQLHEHTFVKTYAEALGGEAQAKAIHQTAITRKAQSQHLWANLRPNPSIHKVKAFADVKAVKTTFESLPGYQEIFGSLDFCDCKDCQSIYGPAAYLVDLLRIIEEGITRPNTDIADGLHFFDRRPDIAQISLTCENTHQLVPYLQIVNEVVGNAMAKELDTKDALYALTQQQYPFGLPFHQPLAQIRAAFEHFKVALSDVYRALDPEQKASAATAREALHISVEEKAMYTAAPTDQLEDKMIACYDVPLKEGYWGGLYKAAVFMEKTGLSRSELASLLHQNLHTEELASEDIPHTFFINQSLKSKQFLDIRPNTTDPGSPFEEVGPPTLPTFERLNTFIRLANKLNWSYEDLNWVLTSVQGSHAPDKIDDTLEQLAQVQTLAQKLHWELPKLCSLWFDIKTIGRGSGSISEAPFDQLFNNHRLLANDAVGIYRPASAGEKAVFQNPLYQDDSLIWLVQGTETAKGLQLPSAEKQKQALLILSAIPAHYEELTALAQALWGKAGAQNQSLLIPLTVGRLSALYRHASLARALHMLVPTYLELLLQMGIGAVESLTPAQVGDILQTAEWLNQADLGVYDISFIETGKPNPFVKEAYTEKSLLAFLHSLLPKLQKDRIHAHGFAHHSISKESSRKVFENLLTAGFIDQLGLFQKPPGDEAEVIFKGISSFKEKPKEKRYVMDRLNKYAQDQLNSFGSEVANLMGFSAEISAALCVGVSSLLGQTSLFQYMGLRPLFSMAAEMVLTPPKNKRKEEQHLHANKLREIFNAQNFEIDLSKDLKIEYQAPGKWRIEDKGNDHTFFASLDENQDKLFILAKVGHANAKEISEEVGTYFNVLARYALLAEQLHLDTADLSLLFMRPQAFSITDPQSLKINDIRQVAALKQLQAAFDDKQGRLLAFLLLSWGDSVSDADRLTALQAVTGWQAAQAKILIEAFYQQVSACKTVAQLRQLQAVFDILEKMGLGMESLMSVSDLKTMPVSPVYWLVYQEIASLLRTAIKAKVTEKAWPAAQQAIDQPVLEATRDALVSVAVWKLGKRYPSIQHGRNLYEFLLIDVENAGCRQISYVKQALNSAQLYLQRCRLGEEENVAIQPDHIPAVWWEWIMNYRIWQANREIFLYPENYLDPSLRKDKTALFQQLEQSLMQGQLSDSLVESSFRKYLDGLMKLASLEYVDAYHASVKGQAGLLTDTLFLFARTTSQPYEYYYISQPEGGAWSSWQALDLKIQGKYITPVYAFNRLFIFWVEQQKQQDTDPTAKAKSNGSPPKMSLYKMAIKYSYQTLDGKWSGPQAVKMDPGSRQENEKLIYAKTEALDGELSFAYGSMLDMHWHKVAALLVDNAEAAEKLLLFYGPLLESQRYGYLAEADFKPTGDNRLDELRQSDLQVAGKLLQVIAAHQNGNQLLKTQMVFDENLKASHLLDGHEYLLFTGKGAKRSAPVFRPLIDAHLRKLAIIPSNEPVYDNYRGGIADGPGQIKPAQKVTAASLGEILNDFFAAMQNASGEKFSEISTSIDGMSGKVRDAMRDALAKQLVIELKQNKYVDEKGVVQPKIFGISAAAFKAEMPSLRDVEEGKDLLESKEILNYVKSTAGTPVLFNKLDDTGLSSFDVKNQPGWFVLQNGAETFLVKTKALPKLSSALKLAQPEMPFNPNSFTFFTRVPVAAKDLSTQIFRNLQGLKLLDSQGKVNVQNVVSFDFSTFPKAYKVAISIKGKKENYPENLDDNDLQALKATLLSKPISMAYEAEGFNNPDLSYQLNKLNFEVERLSSHVAPALSGKLFAEGIDGLLTLASQEKPAQSKYNFDRLQASPMISSRPAIADGDQVPFEGPYGKYFWELFFFAPLLVAERYQVNQQFQQAEKWFQYIFNPTIPATSGYWQFLPFRKHKLESLKHQLTNSAEIKAYDDDPFDPHAIARMRIGAYEKAVVMKYINNLLGWGDQEFERYSWESIVAATNLYTYAYDLLGEKPVDEGSCEKENPVTFQEIQDAYQKGNIPQFLLDLENSLPAPDSGQQISFAHVPFNELNSYFCVPENSQFLTYWNKVQDRLFKIRHCLNIDGQAEPLPLFQPPIDPMALVRAAASGSDVLTNAAQLPQAISPYRFPTVLKAARQFAQQLTQLGQQLLALLEKRDAAALERLRVTQENQLLTLSAKMYEDRIAIAQAQIDALTQQQQTADDTAAHYKKLVSDGWNAEEKAQVAFRAMSVVSLLIAEGFHFGAAVGFLLPNIYGLSDGGGSLGGSAMGLAGIATDGATGYRYLSDIMAASASYTRRGKNWGFQQKLAEDESARITIALKGSNAQLSLAQAEQMSYQTELAHIQKQETFFKQKFTNQELYDWMIGRLSAVYFQAYRLAQEAAISAQAAYQFELDSTDNFIQFNYWDSLHKGLLAGESLLLSIDQLEQAFLNNHRRSLEIEKVISLSTVFAEAFQSFRQSGSQTAGQMSFFLEEALFDKDFPGHYARKLKTVSVSISFKNDPEPLSEIHATLTQVNNYVVTSADIEAVDFLLQLNQPQSSTNTSPPASLRIDWLPNQEIAISKGKDDLGMFALDFFQDERYFPFEGTGAISKWQLSIPPENNPKLFGQIDDVIIRLRYTALDGGSAFRDQVKAKSS